MLGCVSSSLTSISWLCSMAYKSSNYSIYFNSLSMTNSVMVLFFCRVSHITTFCGSTCFNYNLFSTIYVSFLSWALRFKTSLKYCIRAWSILLSTSLNHYWNYIILLVPILKLLNFDYYNCITTYITQLKCYLFLDLRMQKHCRGYSLNCLENICRVKLFSLTLRLSHLPIMDLRTYNSASRSHSYRCIFWVRAFSNNSIQRKYTATCSSFPSFPISFQ
jgi:hypothetical protein